MILNSSSSSSFSSERRLHELRRKDVETGRQDPSTPADEVRRLRSHLPSRVVRQFVQGPEAESGLLHQEFLRREEGRRRRVVEEGEDGPRCTQRTPGEGQRSKGGQGR